MQKLVAMMLMLSLIISGCGPLSHGFYSFYSEDFDRTQVQAAANAGKLKNLGRFEVTAGGCFNFWRDEADKNIVFSAIKAKLMAMGGNVAGNVVIKRKWYDVVLFLLIIPGLLGCSNWQVSGEALLVE